MSDPAYTISDQLSVANSTSGSIRLFPETSTAPVIVQSSNTDQITFEIDDPSENDILRVVADGSDWRVTWQNLPSVNGQRTFVAGTLDSDGVGAQVSDATLAVVTYFKWPGTTAIGTPTSIDVLARGLNAGDEGNFTIEDVTNSNTIASTTGETLPIDPSPPELIDVGALSNVSAGEAVWELQASGNAVGEEVDIYSVNVNF